MSTVYAARDLRFRHVERLCAIKEMHVDAPDDKTRVLRIANFEREAAMLAMLNHPYIPKIFDFFSDGGLIYLVLEFIEGQDLESMIDNWTEPPTEDTLIDWAIQILDVLAYLHEQQPEPIVFRDLKPSNVMLRPNGSIVLIDFGIARTFQPMHRGTMIGTEGYAPPEQYRGIAEPRGDIYALGATLHHLATRSDPRNETPFTFEQRKVRSLNPDLSEGFEQIIDRALAYSAADRFPSAAAMTQALQTLRVQERNDLTQPTSISLPGTNGDGFEAQAVDASSVEPDPLPDGSQIGRDRVVWAVHTGDEVRGSAMIQHGRAFIGSYDGYLYAINLKDGTIAWRYRSQRGITTRPVDVDDSIIFGSEDQNVYALRAGNGRMQWSFRAAMAVRSSPAQIGDRIVVGADDGYCYCLEAHEGSLAWRQRTWGPVRSSPAIFQNSVVVGSDDGAVYRLASEDGRSTWRCHFGQRIMSSPAVESGIVVVGVVDGGVYGIDFNTGERLWQHQTQRPVLASPSILGSVAFIGSTDGAVYALNLQDGTELWRSQIGNQITSSVAVHGGYGYVGTIEGNVHCLSLKDGETVWRYKLDGPVTSTPALGDGVVVLGSLDHRIYGLRL